MTPAGAETRLALVIGNSAYKHTARLANPASDADLMASTLVTAGFKVTKVLDVDREPMRAAMFAFSRSLRQPDTVGLFYFAGHGVQVNGLNYLLPTDADIQGEEEVKSQGVEISEFLQTLNSIGGTEGRLNIVILDACRNNPFARGWRSVGRGLASVDAPRGTLIAFATAPGDVAYDGNDGNSPYAKGLAQSILKRGLTIEQTFKAARAYVEAATATQRRVQTPWESTSLKGEFYFVPGDGPVAGGRIETAPAKAAAAAKHVALPSPPAKQAAGQCQVIADAIESPLTLRIGAKVCSQDGIDTAVVRRIGDTTVGFVVNGGLEDTCKNGDLCGFKWRAGPMLFVPRINVGPDGAQVTLLPR